MFYKIEWNGVEYYSLKAAAKACGITTQAMKYRVDQGYTCDDDMYKPSRGVEDLTDVSQRPVGVVMQKYGEVWVPRRERDIEYCTSVINGLRLYIEMLQEGYTHQQILYIKNKELFKDMIENATFLDGQTAYQRFIKGGHEVAEDSGSCVYFLYSESAKAIKVGSTINIRVRMNSYRARDKVKLIALILTPYAHRMEKLIHEKLGGVITRGNRSEYFDSSEVIAWVNINTPLRLSVDLLNRGV